ncbi:hypothetical protein QZM18_15735 [Burkholderia diffusa]|uniref:hypothetical protein n=1 Tax=Burkholderia diffusa TaxID=488732 RepID=UPI00264BDEC8|nr:hypothetical protein [Burkholderia diffusa]MDN7905549.1 hypothetical protein [Burkholderia diffusa]
MAAKKPKSLIADIEIAEIEYNILIFQASVERISSDIAIMQKRKSILEKKVEYLKDCLAKGVEPELDIHIAGPHRPTMWGGSSD